MIKPSKIKNLRNINDKYLTPYSLIQQLLDIKKDIPKNALIFEPCCSNEKTIVNTLIKNGYNNIEYNIFDETNPKTDFLNFNEDKKYEYIITNTPYGRVVKQFINKMKKIAIKQVIALYTFNILSGTDNYDNIWLDENYKLKEIYLFTRPPWLLDTIREDGKYKTGINGYAWFVWENGYTGEPVLRHIDNNRFVLSKKDKSV